MKRIGLLFASVLALATVGAVAQSPTAINPGFQNSPSIQQVGGQDDVTGNSYFAKGVFVEGALYTNSLTVGMAAGPAAANTGVANATGGTVAAGNNFAKCVAVDWFGGISLPGAETAAAVVTSGSNASITWTCPVVAGAAYYQVWVGATSNSEANWFPTATTPSGTNNVVTQTLPIASGNSGTINTAATSGGVVLNGGARKGTFTCTSAGTIVVANANYLKTSDVVISWQSGTAAVGNPYITASTPGTSFSATCGTGNTAVYNYNILN